MKPEEQILLIKKRYSELECLGIPAKLYYNAVKLIERHVYVVIKQSKIYIFKKDDYKLHDGQNGSHTKYFSTDDILLLLNDSFGLEKTLGYTVYSEWLREKIINCKMSENSTKYWDFLCLPTEYTELEIDDDNEYNF